MGELAVKTVSLRDIKPPSMDLVPAVISEETKNIAAGQIQVLNDFIKLVEKVRKEVTAPLNSEVRAINNQARQLVAIPESNRNRLTNAIFEWQQEEQRKAMAAERRAAEEAAAKVVESCGVTEAAEPPLPVKPEPVKKAIATRTLTTFEVIDFRKVPDDYKIVNEKAVLDALKAGRNVPGIKAHRNEVPINRVL